jgi:FAD binding domain/Berberine and berberine like
VLANPVIVDRSDPRFDTLKRGNNLRFPAGDAEAPDRIILCSDSAEIADALQRVVTAGMRPTLRSGGHCYEDFVANNPHGAIIDVSLHNNVDAASPSGPYRIAAGAKLGDVYQTLYKKFNRTLPAGTCYMVGAGGHISGGGYGLLARQHGLTVDWVSALKVLTVDGHGKVVEHRVDRSHDPDLFRACLGAGGGNFGIVTDFYFEKLPAAPREVAEANLHFPWASLTADGLFRILSVYGEYWNTRGRDFATWGLAAVLTIGPRHPGNAINISLQYCNAEGNAGNGAILQEFINRFAALNPTIHEQGLKVQGVTRRPWLEATLDGSDSGDPARAKYKSTYMKMPFTRAESDTLYLYLTSKDIDAHGFVLEIDGFGGAANTPARAGDTSIVQRSSIMKLQWQCYWEDEAEDADRLKFMDDFYTRMYTGPHVPPEFQGTPFGDRYEGCYINYPDADMLRYSYWPELYYGRTGLYPFLQAVKRRYDPNNIFHSSMSIR